MTTPANTTVIAPQHSVTEFPKDPPRKSTDELRKMKFRVLKGKHAENKRVYKAGDIVETTIDLEAKFNSSQPSAARKFQRVDDDTEANVGIPFLAGQPTVDQSPVATVSQEITRKTDNKEALKNARDYLSKIERMTVKELLYHAQEEKIDLKGAMNKEEILKVLRASVGVS